MNTTTKIHGPFATLGGKVYYEVRTHDPEAPGAVGAVVHRTKPVKPCSAASERAYQACAAIVAAWLA